MRARLAIAFLFAAAGALAAPAGDKPPEPVGYRTQDYRALTPATLTGGKVLTDDQTYRLWRDHGAVFVDTLPAVPRPAGLRPDVVWRDKPRDDIPGSVWLPDTGYGELAPVMEDYFKKGLRKATGSNMSQPLVFYCLRDCWMSWNAAKRAIALGYRDVSWYPDGTDGWAQAGHPLESRKPEPRP